MRIRQKLKMIGMRALLLCAAAALLAPPALALDDDEFGGYPADELTISVGYFGGPYYEKAVFTLDELWAMDVVYADYTFIDSMPSVVIDHVAGIRLSDLLDAAGIDLNSVQNLHFWTNDKTSSYYTSFTRTQLIDTPRYCYYSLPDNFDQDEGVGNEYATLDGVRVDTVIALADDWNRCIAGASFGSDYLNLNTNTRFRLIFGQTDAVEQTASRSAKWIHAIVVELGGTPTLTLDASVLELEVGSTYRTAPTVSAADSVIAENAQFTWSSSDESVATVDADGTITVHGEGSAEITVSFAGASATLLVNGTPGESAAPTSTQPPQDSQGEETQPAPEETAGTQLTQQETGETHIVPPQSQGDSETGAVQNWRVYEMSQTAVALPEIREESPLLPAVGAAALALLLLSAALRTAQYFRQIRRN